MPKYNPPGRWSGVSSGQYGEWEELGEMITRPRMIVSVRGEERDGKTRFALTSPEPIAMFPLDNNSLEVAQKMKRAGKNILIPREPLELKDASSQVEYEGLWMRFVSLYGAALANPTIRSVVVDTGSDLYELCRLALFGRLEQVPQHYYGKVYVQFFDLLKKVKLTDKNLAIIHRLKDEYIKSGKDSARSGNRILNGVQDVKYKVQINVICWRDLERRREATADDMGSEGFGITIENCTQNETLANTYIEEPDNTWMGLGMRVYPESTEDDWK